MPDLLVFIPVFRLVLETVDAVVQLRWAGGRIDRLFGEDLLTLPGPANHLAQYQQAWTLAQQYDALVTVESDIVPPADTALRLWECLQHADVALGLYVFRTTERVNACPPGHNVGQGYTLEQLRGLWGRVVPVSGVGFGCAMFSRRALEIMPRQCNTYCDLLWFQDALQAGLRVVCDTGVVCGHVWQSEILYPSPKGVVRMKAQADELRDLPERVRVRMLVSVASPYGCPSAGDELDIPLHDALSWQTAGYCQILEDERVRNRQSIENVSQHQRRRGRRAVGTAVGGGNNDN